MRQTRIEFEVDGQPVEGVMAGPAEHGTGMPAAVVCHPHPLFGGSMDSPVVVAICYELARLGIASLRFNFRSPADHSPLVGEGAAQDVATAFRVIRQWDQVDPRRCAVAGYSFGAGAILKAWPHLGEARAISLVAPPLNALKGSPVGYDARPRQLVVGDEDKLVQADELTAIAGTMQRPPELVRLAGANHLLRGHEREAGVAVAEFLAGTIAGDRARRT